MHVGILGYGEIGSSLGSILKRTYDVTVQDPRLHKKFKGGIDIMHVCIPYSDRFIPLVVQLIVDYEPVLVVIHSTVQVGTTRKIYDAMHGRLNIVHSPCMGVHPHLECSMVTFTKMVGPVTAESGKMAVDHLGKAGIRIVECDGPEETELGKILSTTYYMTNIIYCKQVYGLCEKNNINFDQVYTLFNNIYNAGYAAMGMDHVIRPVLKPVSGPMGGHCLRPNIELLNGFANDDFFKLLQELDDSYRGEQDASD